MAPHAVFLNDGCGKAGQVHDLRFHSERKHGGMFQTIVSLERIFPGKRRVREVAIVARNIPTV